MQYSAEEQAEISRNRVGKIIWIASIGLLLLACFGGGSTSAVGATIMIIGFFVGCFLTMGNRSKSRIDELHRNAQVQADLMVKMAKAGMSPGDISDGISAMNRPKRTSNSGTKEIIKGAVIGGVVAGDAGAVVGATVAKNKLDNEKKRKL